MNRKQQELRKPPWLDKKIQYTEEMHEVKSVLSQLGLNTVCKSARCPNLSECFFNKRATFLILGNKCTRGCSFCSVEKAMSGEKLTLSKGEPQRVLDAVKALGLRYVVITSVTRDDLEDGGAGQFARSIQVVREYDSSIKVEVLTPDFKGRTKFIDTVAQAAPDVFNHNVETVPRLYRRIRPGADYKRSVGFLSYIHREYPLIFLKSGLMVGLGETKDEIIEVLGDLCSAGCSSVTIGQYLRPCRSNVPVVEYITPELFRFYKKEAKKMGFSWVASGPYVRSSYMAHEGYDALVKNEQGSYNNFQS